MALQNIVNVHSATSAQLNFQFMRLHSTANSILDVLFTNAKLLQPPHHRIESAEDGSSDGMKDDR